MTTDQSRPCSRKDSMGASDSKSQASKGLKPEKDYFVNTRYKRLSAYLVKALKNTSEGAREEVVNQLEDTDMEKVDVEGFCTSFESEPKGENQ